MEWFHFFCPVRTRGWQLYFTFNSLSTLKPHLGMNVVVSHHCVPSRQRDPLQPWCLPLPSPCIRPADWLEGQEAQVMWPDGPITVHVARLLISVEFNQKTSDLPVAAKRKKMGVVKLFLAFFFLFHPPHLPPPAISFWEVGLGVEVSALLCSNSKHFLYNSVLNLHQSLHHIKLTRGVKIMILLCTCQNVQTGLSLYANYNRSSACTDACHFFVLIQPSWLTGHKKQVTYLFLYHLSLLVLKLKFYASCSNSTHLFMLQISIYKRWLVFWMFF